jgi:hypothetical protein
VEGSCRGPISDTVPELSEGTEENLEELQPEQSLSQSRFDLPNTSQKRS